MHNQHKKFRCHNFRLKNSDFEFWIKAIHLANVFNYFFKCDILCWIIQEGASTRLPGVFRSIKKNSPSHLEYNVNVQTAKKWIYWFYKFGQNLTYLGIGLTPQMDLFVFPKSLSLLLLLLFLLLFWCLFLYNVNVQTAKKWIYWFYKFGQNLTYLGIGLTPQMDLFVFPKSLSLLLIFLLLFWCLFLISIIVFVNIIIKIFIIFILFLFYYSNYY